MPSPSNSPALPRNDCVEFTAEVPADGVLRADLGKLKIMLRNLVGNAFKFTPRGRVTLQAPMAPAGDAIFVVEDTGIGIPASEREKIFEMFYQVSRPGELSRGVGLGLYIVRRFVELLRGGVTVESEEQRRTRFTVTVPLLSRGRAEGPALTGNALEATEREPADLPDSGRARAG